MNDPMDRPVNTADLVPVDEAAANSHHDAGAEDAALFAPDAREAFRKQWTEVQGGFVDEPRQSVQQADALVAEVIQRLSRTFAGQRAKLEEAWGRGGEVSTEDLRCTLKRYRDFFDKLLAV